MNECNMRTALVFGLLASVIFSSAESLAYEMYTIAPRLHYTQHQYDFMFDDSEGYGVGIAIGGMPTFDFRPPGFGGKLPMLFAADYYTNKLKYTSGDNVSHSLNTSRIKLKISELAAEEDADLFAVGYYIRKIDHPVVTYDLGYNSAQLDAIESTGLGVSIAIAPKWQFENGLFISGAIMADVGGAYNTGLPEELDDKKYTIDLSGAVSINIGQEFDRVTWTGGWSIGYQLTIDEFDAEDQLVEKDGTVYSIEVVPSRMHDITAQFFVRF